MTVFLIRYTNDVEKTRWYDFCGEKHPTVDAQTMTWPVDHEDLAYGESYQAGVDRLSARWPELEGLYGKVFPISTFTRRDRLLMLRKMLEIASSVVMSSDDSVDYAMRDAEEAIKLLVYGMQSTDAADRAACIAWIDGGCKGPGPARHKYILSTGAGAPRRP